MEEIMKIEIIESIGKKVNRAFLGNAFEAIKACGITGKVIVVRDLKTIMKYGIKSTPALVINGVVMFAGNLPAPEDILKLLQQNMQNFS
jgi:protein-disulfide isomerase